MDSVQKRVPKRKSRSSKSRPAQSSEYVSKSALRGGKFPPGVNPPDVTYQPWWSVTVVTTEKGGMSMTVKDICDRVRAQTDPNKRGFNQKTSASTEEGSFRMQIRIMSISAWNLTGRMLALSVEDFTDSNTASGGRDQLCGIVDTGTSQHTPAVGYKLPLSAASHVLRNDDKGGALSIFETQAASGDIVVAYVKILFRFDGPVRIPTYSSPIDQASDNICKEIDEDSQELNESIKNLTLTIDRLIEKQPSTATRVINGVSHLAAYVLPLTGSHQGRSPASSIIASLREAGKSVPHLETDEALGLGEPFVHVVGAK